MNTLNDIYFKTTTTTTTTTTLMGFDTIEINLVFYVDPANKGKTKITPQKNILLSEVSFEQTVSYSPPPPPPIP